MSLACGTLLVALCLFLLSSEPAAFVIIYLTLKCLKRRGLGGPGIADENIPRYTAGQEGIIYFLLLKLKKKKKCEEKKSVKKK